jgi:hypothetical protein
LQFVTPVWYTDLLFRVFWNKKSITTFAYNFKCFKRISKKKRLLASSCPSVRLSHSAWNISSPTGWIVINFGIWEFFEELD